MAGRFKGFSGIADTLKSIQLPEINTSPLTVPDTRSRAEYREDFEKELASLDKQVLIELKNKIIKIKASSGDHENDFWGHKNDIENSIIKFIRYIEKFEEHSYEGSRKLSLKGQELKLEAKHDWAEKSRLFFFRVLASVLFVCTLFAIGYIEREYDWATLPLSKYVKPVPSSIIK